jgi:hypothetical protein
MAGLGAHPLAAPDEADDEPDPERRAPHDDAREHAPRRALAMQQAYEPRAADVEQERHDVTEVDGGAERDRRHRAPRRRPLAEPIERSDGAGHQRQPEAGVNEAEREAERPQKRKGEEAEPRAAAEARRQPRDAERQRQHVEREHQAIGEVDADDGRDEAHRHVVAPVRIEPEVERVILREVPAGIVQMHPHRRRRHVVRQIRQRVVAHAPDGEQRSHDERDEDVDERIAASHARREL